MDREVDTDEPAGGGKLEGVGIPTIKEHRDVMKPVEQKMCDEFIAYLILKDKVYVDKKNVWDIPMEEDNISFLEHEENGIAKFDKLAQREQPSPWKRFSADRGTKNGAKNG